MPTEGQKGKPVHQPIISRPGRTKITVAWAAAEDAIVWTILFSQMVAPLNRRSTAMEMTAAGIEVAKVRATFSPA